MPQMEGCHPAYGIGAIHDVRSTAPVNVAIYEPGDDEAIVTGVRVRLDCLDPVSETHQCWSELVSDRNETVDQ